MCYNMGDSKKIFEAAIELFFVLISIPVSRCTNISTVCYGTDGLSCTTHKLSCPSPLVIQIINTSYGYRPGCNDIDGLTTCNTTCCNEEPGDCFIPFSSDVYQRVTENCNGREKCELTRFRRYNTTDTVCNGRIVSAYSKIQYDCVLNGRQNITQSTIQSASEVTQTSTALYSTDLIASTSFTTQYSTDLIVSTSTTQCPQCTALQNDNSGVIGGVLGTFLIVSVIINVGLAVYFTRKMKSLSSTPRENNYDGITDIGRDQTPTTYDALQVQSTASFNHDAKKKSDNSHTYYNTKGDSISRDINPYYENMKRP